ncbi:MAG TPA: hypothetical protein VGF67_21320 [Ktedonobacteraceae bacterium]|jgi:hypothetical protein
MSAMVQVFKLYERRNAERWGRAGYHGQQLHQTIGEQKKLNLVQVQVDEIEEADAPQSPGRVGRCRGRRACGWPGWRA